LFQKAKDETPWETKLRKKKEEKKARRKAAKAAYQKEEMMLEDEDEEQNKKPKDSKKDKKKHKETPEEAKAREELELVMLPEGKVETKKGFNLQQLLKDEKNAKKKGKKKREALEKLAKDDFSINVTDPRFEKLFTQSYDYGIDPTHKNYKDTSAMKKIMKERVERRSKADQEQAAEEQTPEGKSLSSLVDSVKRKAAAHPTISKKPKTK
jgi:hypothetical protein